MVLELQDMDREVSWPYKVNAVGPSDFYNSGVVGGEYCLHPSLDGQVWDFYISNFNPRSRIGDFFFFYFKKKVFRYDVGCRVEWILWLWLLLNSKCSLCVVFGKYQECLGIGYLWLLFWS